MGKNFQRYFKWAIKSIQKSEYRQRIIEWSNIVHKRLVKLMGKTSRIKKMELYSLLQTYVPVKESASFHISFHYKIPLDNINAIRKGHSQCKKWNRK